MPTLNRNTARSAATVSRSEATFTLESVGDIQGQAEYVHFTYLGEKNMEREPDREVQHHAHHRRSDCGERGGEGRCRAGFDKRGTQENPQKARHEGHPGGQQAADRTGEQWRAALRGARNAPMKPTNCTTMISGPGVVSAMPRPSSISPGRSQP